MAPGRDTLPSPLIGHVGFWSQLLPLSAGLARPSRVTSARAWIVLWAVLGFIEDWAAYVFAHYHKLYNHIIYHIGLPIDAAIILMALACWEPRRRARTAFHVAIPILLAAAFVIVRLLENPYSFSQYMAPMVGITTTAACVYTMMARAEQVVAPLYRHDWFWACAGWILEYAVHGMVTPLAGHLLAVDPAFALRVYAAASWVAVAGMLLVFVALLCPTASAAEYAPHPVIADRVSGIRAL